MHLATKAASLDLITSYCFSHSFDTLKAPKFEHQILLGMDSVTAFGRRYRHVAGLRNILTKIMPQQVARMLGSDPTAVVVQLRQLRELVTGVMGEISGVANSRGLERGRKWGVRQDGRSRLL